MIAVINKRAVTPELVEGRRIQRRPRCFDGLSMRIQKMILGLGNDLIDIRRIEKTIAKHGERFIARIYTDIERAKSDRRAAARRLLCQALRRQGGLRQGAGNRP